MNGLHIILRGFRVSRPCIQQSVFKLLLKVVSDLVVSVLLEWNKLDTDMRNSTSINIFKKPLLQFARPSPKSLFNCHISTGIKYEIRSRLDQSHSREHRFKHSFQDTLNHFAIAVVKQKQLHCHFYIKPKITKILLKHLFLEILLIMQQSTH